MSWEDIRENLDEAVRTINELQDIDDTFWFDDKGELSKKLHKALDTAIEKSHVEDIEKE